LGSGEHRFRAEVWSCRHAIAMRFDILEVETDIHFEDRVARFRKSFAFAIKFYTLFHVPDPEQQVALHKTLQIKLIIVKTNYLVLVIKSF
jgi:hypothetical protein